MVHQFHGDGELGFFGGVVAGIALDLIVESCPELAVAAVDVPDWAGESSHRKGLGDGAHRVLN